MDVENGDQSLKISSISDNQIPQTGGKKIILLCENIRSKDIAVVFYDGSGDETKRIVVKPDYIHHHCSIVLYSTPSMLPYNQVKNKIYVSLMRPSDGRFGPAIEMSIV